MKTYIQNLREKVGTDLLLCPSVAAVINNAEGQILLQEKASGEGWSLPAGAIELGETPEEAVIREVMEETGFPVSIDRILGVFGGKAFRYTYPNGDQVEYVVTLFRCRIISTQRPISDGETKSIRYFSETGMPPLALPYPRPMLFAK
ncbi:MULTISPECIES: NUDIX domain-containing protein [unclassified Ensifer]|uniref:NUDIX domain-containing protein n=1 Tax=unclassified Ensifer TaxID=2633371 RepID=UPI000812DB93|nr:MULTISPECIES: NUDIX domain-containing protein [unclassified Ensifer]OCP09135.1 NUDIX hydrolase [Ensifer sp. LC13]OCP10324.1 NUDIX hydrolase [Ensifer sp. LC11]OCP14076.1 NUDIX hydrolase [Ensifer sp. LC14]OCP32381.1 NUDIX hydrolase [Ensifer sp. LC499]